MRGLRWSVRCSHLNSDSRGTFLRHMLIPSSSFTVVYYHYQREIPSYRHASYTDQRCFTMNPTHISYTICSYHSCPSQVSTIAATERPLFEIVCFTHIRYAGCSYNPLPSQVYSNATTERLLLEIGCLSRYLLVPSFPSTS